jgi:hypothetical protein
MGKKGLRVILLALTSLLLLALVIAMASGAEASDEPIITGSEPPFIGPWSIDRDTAIEDGELNLSMDIYVNRGVELLITNVTLNIMRDFPHQYQFTVMSGATCIVSDSVMNLDTFSAESQASINFEAGTLVKTTGRFYGTCNNFFAEDTEFQNTGRDGNPDEPGEDAIFIADGKVNSEFIRVSILNIAGNAGLTSPGVDGRTGGRALFFSNVTTWIDCAIENKAGSSRNGGLGLTGASGGSGGFGADVEVRMSASYLENLTIDTMASSGGIGARGSDNTAGNGGHGGDGADGGSAFVSIESPSILEIYGCSFNAMSGAGGSGGNGGSAIDGEGGTAGDGANAGMCSIEVTCLDDIIIEDTEIIALGGEGGYGGDYGRHVEGSGTYGIPSPGGDGGNAVVEILGAVSMFPEDLRVEARGGAGLDGGAGFGQGETGGIGGEGEVIVHAEASMEGSGIDLLSVGGNGGHGGPAFSDIVGNGGDGGDSRVEFTGLLQMTIDAFSIYVIEGVGGDGRDTIYNGQPGIPTLDLETELLDAREGTFNMPLDDLTGNARGFLYNVLFDMEFGIHVLPIGDATVIEVFSVTVLVVDDPDPAKATPLEGYEVTVFEIATGALVAQSTTNEDGECFFDLPAFEYTSLAVNYKGSYHFIASTPDKKTTKKVRGEVQAITYITISIKQNTEPPLVTIEEPEDGTNYPFDKIDKRVMEVKGFVTDEDESPIIAMFVKLYPEAQDPNAWPEFKLGLSPVPLEDLADQEFRWGRYFPPDEHSNKWKFFFRFDIIGGDVLYESEAYIFQTRANDGVHITVDTVSLDVQIEPEQEPPRMRIYASVNPGVTALDLVEFNGTVLNVEELYTNGVEIKYYAWDFESDGVIDYYSTEDASTFHIYPDEDTEVKKTATLTVVDTLGRSISTPKGITVTPPPIPEESWWDVFIKYMPFIIAAFLVILIAVGVLSARARRVQAAVADEERKRIEEAMANIHECPRCGDLLETSFTTCPRCKVEDDLEESRELIEELKDQGIIVLEQEDLLDKALVSYEGRDFDTADLFINQAVEQSNHNALRFRQTTEELERVEGLISTLEERGVDIPDVEMRVYHTKLALGRSDFDGAKEIADEILGEISALDAESRKDEIFIEIQRTEKEIRTAKALAEVDTVPANRALEASKAAFGIKDYVEAEAKMKDAEKLLEDPEWSPEKELEEEELKRAEAEKMAVSAAETEAILEEERKRKEELDAISTGETDEVKIMSFEEEQAEADKELPLDKGEVVDHEVSREEVDPERRSWYTRPSPLPTWYRSLNPKSPRSKRNRSR